MTRVALLWHMHQPFYQDLATGEHVLPWVRMHALKDYYGMAAVLREFPGVRVTFNLVPSMLVQLEAFARGEARDRHLDIGLKPAGALSADERAFCLQNFFHAFAPRMIEPYPRYAELLARRGAGAGAGAAGAGMSPMSLAAQFSVDDLRDLQVWHKLAWVDPAYLESDPRVRQLVAKGRGFTEDDKRLLREIELEILGRVIPEYREAAARGQVELSTSPFYHPILPLLCDTDVYLRTHPHSRMPRERFRHPEDASEQLERAVEYHERLFGTRPAGLWPSEGSVSDEMVPLVGKAGLAWMATDEEILARSLNLHLTRDGIAQVEQPEVLYQTYAVGDARVACAFRDHALSDLIGFKYASWSPEGAADDFIARVSEAGRRYTARTGREATVAIILDGENAWEHYAGGGRPFLRALYGRLQHHPELRTVTMGEACREPGGLLPSIAPGSWINGDFYIWIGHADDHRAWGQLADARRQLESPPAGVPEEAIATAREEMLIAEGSDWFWWYGDDHSSDHDLEFDELFRRHVRNVYRSLGVAVPEELLVSNITTQAPAGGITEPTALIRPTIDGEVTSYFEWAGAGGIETLETAGAMHEVVVPGPGLTAVEYGFDTDRLYLRADSGVPMSVLLSAGFEVTVRFLKPARLELVVGASPDGRVSASLIEREASGVRAIPCPGLEASAARIAELAVPFGCLGLAAGQPAAFLVTLRRDGAEVEQHPRHRPVEFLVPDAAFAARHWTA